MLGRKYHHFGEFEHLLCFKILHDLFFHPKIKILLKSSKYVRPWTLAYCLMTTNSPLIFFQEPEVEEPEIAAAVSPAGEREVTLERSLYTDDISPSHERGQVDVPHQVKCPIPVV